MASVLEGGKVNSCMDMEFKSIENEVIDGASEDINSIYDKMVMLKKRYSKREE